MRRFSLAVLALWFIVSLSLDAQSAPSKPAAPQTARQALIEMFFGQEPNHLEKHLPDVTRKAFQSLNGSDGGNFLRTFSMLSAQAKSSNANLETFDTGSTLVTVTSPHGASNEKVEITVEGDSLSGDEDQIELAAHMFRAGKEETLPFIPRFTFSMKMETEVWRLNEISVTVRMPLADPAFLDSLMERQRTQNEQMTQYSMGSLVSAEKAYLTANGGYACTLAALGGTNKQAGGNQKYLWDTQLASGKKNGYVFAISGCDSSHYQLGAEPAVAGAGRAFCADESGTVRASADGKATTCLSSGEPVVQSTPSGISESGGTAYVGTAPQNSLAGIQVPAAGSPQRVRISSGVANGLLVSKITPAYPDAARTARIQGTVVMRALINPAGEVENLTLISGHPLLAPAAIEAVKQWKYKPYLLSGKPVGVDTEIQVNFTLRGGGPSN
jgi:TonB family protein